MAEGRLIQEIKDEFQQIMELIRSGENFLLSGGAGSGKTYSLVQVIKQVIAENPTAKVACMTYTNAAVKEIEERVNHDNLNVSTIHDFLWDNIKHFKKELNKTLVTLLNDPEFTKFKISDMDVIPNDYFDEFEKGIQYLEFLRLKDGIISHDELLIVANHLFANYPKLSDILKDKFKFIFIDEYQDTNRAVVQIFLEHLKKSSKKCVVGFFGDAMQSIYEDGIGNIDEYKGVEQGAVLEVKKEQNRRNPRLIYELANKLRTDGLKQIHSEDITAPNMSNGIIKEGSLKFIYSDNPDISLVKEYIGWDFSASKETKELNLTHNLIATKAGFRNLMDIYDKDLIIKFRDRIKNYIKDENIDTDFSEYKFGEVIDELKFGKAGKELSRVSPTKGMQEYIDSHAEDFTFILSLPYQIVSKIYLDKDQLIDDKKQDEDDQNMKGSKRDNLIKHLYKIQNNIDLYQNKQFNEFIRKTDYKIKSVADKIKLKTDIESLIKTGEKSIEQVIYEADECGICVIDDNLINFQREKTYIYNRVKSIPFSEFQYLYEYLEGKTPFSTQHKTKGAEYNNVLVILDNGKWNDYNFEYLLDENNQYQLLVDGRSKTKSKLESFPGILERTRKIFYVCCTRAKENLVVFYHQPTESIISQAKVWFGEENVIAI